MWRKDRLVRTDGWTREKVQKKRKGERRERDRGRQRERPWFERREA